MNLRELTLKPTIVEDDFKCPLPTQDIKLNLENRQKAIDEYGYGPLNPDLPNRKFWLAKAEEWQLDNPAEAKASLCGNCAAFNQSPEMLDCIEKGIGDPEHQDPEATVEAGDLGYCQFLKFKCASRRTCDAWVSGGPITKDKEVDENFADGKNPGRKGLAKRMGVNTKASVSDLRKTAKNSSGEKQRMAHWMANMKAGKTKASEEMDETKQRLDPKCWKGYRKAGTKMKDGVRVNNCVPTKESKKINNQSTDLDPLDNAEPLSALGSYEQDFSKAEHSRLLKPFIDKLPRDQQIVLNMYYWKEYDVNEISEILKIRPYEIKKLIRDALYSIRKGMYYSNAWKTDRPNRDDIVPSVNEGKVISIDESWEIQIASLVKLLESKS